MADTDFMPRRLDRSFERLAYPAALKSLLLANNPAYCYFWDDFVGTRTGTWPAGTPYAATVGNGTEVIGITQAVNGTMTLTTAGSSSNSAGQGLGLNWNGDQSIYFIARYHISDITNSKYEIGLTDSVADDGAVNVKQASTTFTATDCAVFVRDTTENTTTAFVSNGGAADGDADSGLADINSTFVIAEIVVQGNVAVGYMNGVQIGSGNIEGGNALTPWAYCETLTGSTRTLTLDYWGIMGPRA